MAYQLVQHRYSQRLTLSRMEAGADAVTSGGRPVAAMLLVLAVSPCRAPCLQCGLSAWRQHCLRAAPGAAVAVQRACAGFPTHLQVYWCVAAAFPSGLSETAAQTLSREVPWLGSTPVGHTRAVAQRPVGPGTVSQLRSHAEAFRRGKSHAQSSRGWPALWEAALPSSQQGAGSSPTSWEAPAQP